MNLAEELKFLGFKSFTIEEEDPNAIYVKVWFDFTFYEKKSKIQSGRQEFVKKENDSTPYTKERALKEIIQWIKEPKKNWTLRLI